jgi:hypothetical protein
MSHLLSKLFSIFVGHFALLDPHPDPADQNQCRSGSETLVTPVQDFIVEMGDHYFNWHGTRGNISSPGFNPGILRQTLILMGNRCSSIEYRTLKKSFRRQGGGEHIYFKS